MTTETFVQIAQVIERVGLRKSAIYARMAAGTFPRPIKDGNTSLWVESEVSAWISAHITARNMGQIMGRKDICNKKAAYSAA